MTKTRQEDEVRKTKTRLNDCLLLEIETDQISWKIVSFPTTENANENLVPPTRCHHTAVVFKKKCMALWGQRGATGDDLSALNHDSFRFTCPHTPGVNPKPRAGHAASLVDNSIMLVAARRDRDHRSSLDDVHLLNFETLSWSLMSIVAYLYALSCVQPPGGSD
jgi:hypothetical protein